MNPTTEQKEIIQFAKTGKPLTVIARAGTGKTSTILASCSAGDIVLAFNKKIAEEISDRGANGITWHALILRELKQNGARFRLDSFSEVPYEVTERIKKNNPEDGISMVKEMAKIISILKESVVYYDSDSSRFRIEKEKVDSILSEYPLLYLSKETILPVLEDSISNLSAKRSKISFSDLLLLGLTLPSGNFPQKVWVDEAQDTNLLQLRLAKHLFHRNNVNFVGDPAQAIYHFRGAGSRSMEIIADQFPENKIFPLTVSFRCAKSIINCANSIVPDIKSLSEAPEGKVSYSLEAPKTLASGQAILCRSNKPLLVKLAFFLRNGILCNFKDKGFLREVQDMQRKIKKNGEEREVKKAMSLRDPRDRNLKITLIECAKLIAPNVLKDAISIRGDNFPTLSTIHSSKGLEWDTVFLIDFPTDNPDFSPIETQQELNLKYVGITRAKSNLTIIADEN